MRDAALHDNRTLAQREPEIMKRVEMKRKCGFDQGASPADFPDGDRLEHHHFAAELTKNEDAVGIALIRFFLHPGRDYNTRP